MEPGRGFTRLRLRRFAATLSPNGAAVVALALGTLLLACSHPPSTPASDAGLDPCTPNPCTTPHRTACSTKDAHPVCVCEPGFNDVAGTCVDADPCTPNPCTAPHKTQCTLFGSAAACACDPGYVPDETGGCRMDVPVDCSAQHPDGDDFEPDECPALARDLGGSGEQEEPHTIAPADDADWFKVTASPGRIFRVRTSGAAVPLTAQAFTGDPLAQVGDAHGSAEGVNAAWKAPSAGTLYFRVRAQDPQATGPYAVSIGDLGPDDFGDDAASATEAGATDAIAGLLQFNGDVDVVKLPLAEGHAWEVSGDAPVLERIDSSDSPRWTTKGTPIRTITRIASGESPALFRIRSDDPEALDLGWTLSLTDLGSDDVGDSPAEAEPTAPGATISGSLERADDRDLFRFDAVAPHIYAVRCIPTGPGDCLLTLLDPAGTVIASDLDGSEGFVVHEFQDADTQVTVQVEASAGETFAYALSIEDRGVDDYPDEPPTEWDAGMPVPSLSGSGDIETPGDRDFIPFTADVNHIYRITCTRGTLADCLARVFNSNGIMVAADTDGDDVLLLHEYNGGGQFYVDFSGGPGGIGTYDWMIEDLLHDDHGDDLFTATGMSANAAWVTGDLETPGDQDWFQLSALQGHVYRFTCQRLSLGDCYAALYDPTETLQLQDVDGQDALLLYEVGPAQNEYLRITAPGGEVGTYWVKAEDLGTDDCPDTAAGALPMLADGTAANGSFETPGDLDFRSLSLQQGTTYQLSATGTALAFTLYAPDATTVVASGGTPATFTPTQSGTHYLEVHALASSLTGAYSLSVHP